MLTLGILWDELFLPVRLALPETYTLYPSVLPTVIVAVCDRTLPASSGLAEALAASRLV